MKNYLNLQQQERILAMLNEHIEACENQARTPKSDEHHKILVREANEAKLTRQAFLNSLSREAKQRKALTTLLEARTPIREGKRDGGTFGALSMACEYVEELF